MRRWIACLAVFALVSTTSSYGITMAAGSKELSIEGLFDSSTGDGDFTDVTIFYGEFAEENVEIGLQAAIRNSDNVQQWRAGMRVEYNYTDYQVVPYFGVTLEYANFEVDALSETVVIEGVEVQQEVLTERDDNAFVAGGHVGLKWFLSENVAIAGTFVYEWASESIFEGDEGILDETDATIRLGMRFLFY